MREIGSEFWDVPVVEKTNGLFPQSTQWYLSGRSALQAIISELEDTKSVCLPSWCCDSVIKPFVDAGLDVRFYPVYLSDGFCQEINLDSDVLFLMDFFGHTGKQPDLRSYKGVVIRDITHSLFSNVYDDADYYFGSLRKWCGVWTGGYAWTKDGHRMNPGIAEDKGYTGLRKKAMEEKRDYLCGKTETKGYLKIFYEAEELLESVGIIPAADSDIALAEYLDVEKMVLRRRTNAEVLRKQLSDWLLFPQFSNTDTPMFIPILVPNGKRDELCKYLKKHEIYCPIHWPISKYHRIDKKTLDIYKDEISLVCDQRYTEDDMYRIANVIKRFMED